ncbi:hypothetical protein ACQB60_34415 [Actinomycetota bacterium Odt1-20B]
MTLDDQSARALLRQLDEPDRKCFPRAYDHAAVRARFDRLAGGLDRQYQAACTVDRHVQDGSHHGTIRIPATVTACGNNITVTVSNFGNLAAVTFDDPGRYDGGEESELSQAVDRKRVDNELEVLGYVTLSEHLLGTRYDGVTDLSYFPPEHRPTWFTRFFDYL